MKASETFFIWGVKVDLFGKYEVVKELKKRLFEMDNENREDKNGR